MNNLPLELFFASLALMGIGITTIAYFGWEGAKASWKAHPMAFILGLALAALALIWLFAGSLWTIGAALAACSFVVCRALR